MTAHICFQGMYIKSSFYISFILLLLLIILFLLWDVARYQLHVPLVSHYVKNISGYS